MGRSPALHLKPVHYPLNIPEASLASHKPQPCQIPQFSVLAFMALRICVRTTRILLAGVLLDFRMFDTPSFDFPRMISQDKAR